MEPSEPRPSAAVAVKLARRRVVHYPWSCEIRPRVCVCHAPNPFFLHVHSRRQGLADETNFAVPARLLQNSKRSQLQLQLQHCAATAAAVGTDTAQRVCAAG
eukprot:4537465-Prymnesium_polylepis.1